MTYMFKPIIANIHKNNIIEKIDTSNIDFFPNLYFALINKKITKINIYIAHIELTSENQKSTLIYK